MKPPSLAPRTRFESAGIDIATSRALRDTAARSADHESPIYLYRPSAGKDHESSVKRSFCMEENEHQDDGHVPPSCPVNRKGFTPFYLAAPPINPVIDLFHNTLSYPCSGHPMLPNTNTHNRSIAISCIVEVASRARFWLTSDKLPYLYRLWRAVQRPVFVGVVRLKLRPTTVPHHEQIAFRRWTMADVKERANLPATTRVNASCSRIKEPEWIIINISTSTPLAQPKSQKAIVIGINDQESPHTTLRALEWGVSSSPTARLRTHPTGLIGIGDMAHSILHFLATSNSHQRVTPAYFDLTWTGMYYVDVPASLALEDRPFVDQETQTFGGH
ncbi:hypothetical protein BDN71DRAFT_1510580 [Pleurotus eryngii]|uniref:Uncharacterized protein n=1 Tax=Pleurotus eryngii TaxID=5323 RepID=A0A9P6DCX3_PLEER|nr:hypothetical protein BDN71DRAFT_1510580 [Pleurotus eryngii]